MLFLNRGLISEVWVIFGESFVVKFGSLKEPKNYVSSLLNFSNFRRGSKFQRQGLFLKNFLWKRNASTPLGIEPRTFRLPVECSIIWITEVPHSFSHKIYSRQFGYGYTISWTIYKLFKIISVDYVDNQKNVSLYIT